MTLGKRIHERRKLLDFTQADLAKATNVAIQHIYAIEKDRRLPSLPVLIRIAEQLNSSIDYLALGTQNDSASITDAILAEHRLNAGIKRSLLSLIMELVQISGEGKNP